MESSRSESLFFELFDGLPRQGPGTVKSTCRALDLIPNLGPCSQILDIGSGTGAQSMVLAENTQALIVAVDTHPPFLTDLNREANRLGVSQRLKPCVADMHNLAFKDMSFDLIWCEGAIYNMGFEAGLQSWRRLLKPDGYVALTEVCWREVAIPEECAKFWEREYDAIRDVNELLNAVEACGYETVSHFPLPITAWWDNYYRPLQESLNGFRTRHQNDSLAQDLANRCQQEIDIWQDYGECYGYEFFVLHL